MFSARKFAKKRHKGIAFQVLAADNVPAHRTIRNFHAQQYKVTLLSPTQPHPADKIPIR